MSLRDILEGLGKLQGLLQKRGVHIELIDEAEQLADTVIRYAGSNHVGLTAEEARDKLQAAKSECIAAGDEAAARIAARQVDDDGA